jgi:hypothetical protein
MLKIYIDKIEHSFLKAANDELNDLLNFYFDPFDSSGEEYVFKHLFPSHLYRTNKNRCFQIVHEIREWVRDAATHILTPLHEYALFHILISIKTIFDENELNCTIQQLEDFEEEEIIINGGFRLEDLKDIYFYLENCFEDIDFINVEKEFEAVTRDPALEKEINIQLENYKELVAWDIVQNYEKAKEEFLVLTSMMKDKVTLEKKNGEIFNDIKASVQPKLIFIGDSSLHIEEGDRITRLLSNGHSEGYIVTSSDFYEKHFSIPAHYQLKVRKETLIEQERIQQIINNFNNTFQGDNNRFNNQSNDYSTNITSTKQEIAVFNQLREKINESDIPATKKEILTQSVNQLEESVGKPNFIEKYQQFVATAADHIGLLGPLLPELTKLLTQ